MLLFFEEKCKEKNGTVTIPIIERIYVENGEVEADVVGEQEVPKDIKIKPRLNISTVLS
ncbi:hypothetical protein [Bacillus thuringiensis]|uniref:hypothetical protein n=1 Tax=Bacillus thuringiensis TaxID=1428 RepID=UPI0018EA0E07|nr:hypothetical protein [Bacillus thuringiensis]